MADCIFDQLKSIGAGMPASTELSNQVARIGESISDNTRHIEHLNANFNNVIWMLHQIVGYQQVLQNSVQHCQQRVDCIMDKVCEFGGRSQESDAQALASRVDLMSTKLDRIDLLISTSTKARVIQKRSNTQVDESGSEYDGIGGYSSCEAHAEPLSESLAHDEFENSSNATDSDDNLACYVGVWERMSTNMVRTKMLEQSLSSSCKEIVFSIRRRTSPGSITNDDILEMYGKLLSRCPRLPRTHLSRDGFGQKYGDMHKGGLWRKVCDDFHSGTGDPLDKSDTFLRIFSAMYSQTQLNTTTSRNK